MGSTARPESQFILLNGSLVSWSFNTNPYQSEVTVFSNGTRHLQTIRKYIIGCGDELGPTSVFEDNTAVIRYGRDMGLARTSRTLAQHFHFGRDQQQLGLIDLRGVSSATNLADFFAKPLGKTKFQLNVARRGMQSVAACTHATQHASDPRRPASAAEARRLSPDVVNK